MCVGVLVCVCHSGVNFHVVLSSSFLLALLLAILKDTKSNFIHLLPVVMINNESPSGQLSYQFMNARGFRTMNPRF